MVIACEERTESSVALELDGELVVRLAVHGEGKRRLRVLVHHEPRAILAEDGAVLVLAAALALAHHCHSEMGMSGTG